MRRVRGGWGRGKDRKEGRLAGNLRGMVEIAANEMGGEVGGIVHEGAGEEEGVAGKPEMT